MTEGGHLVDEAIEQGATPFPPYSSIEFCPEPYQKVIVYLSGDQKFDDDQIAYALARFRAGYEGDALERQIVAEKAGRTYAPNTPQPRQEAPQRPRTNERRGNSGGDEEGPSYREEQFPLVEGYECDKCGGPIGEFVTKNGAHLGKCLSTCKDGKFVHTLKDAEGELVFLGD